VSVETAASLYGRPGTKAAVLRREAHDLLLSKRDQHGQVSTNARFVFYEAEGAGLVRKSKPGESRRLPGLPAGVQDLGDAIFYLRDKGIVPWEWITDETRTLHAWRHAPTVAEYVADSVAPARIDLWEGNAPLLLVESRSLGGVLRDICAQRLVDIAATNGQAGGFLRTDIAPALTDNQRPVLYLGDLDHQGDQIEENTRNVLEREAGRAIGWRRLALTREQVAERGLEPIWKRDERYRPAKEHWAWEAEALTQRVLEDLVRDELDALLPEPLEDALEHERRQREAYLAFLEGWPAFLAEWERNA
jgi:hypothetical protein